MKQKASSPRDQARMDYIRRRREEGASTPMIANEIGCRHSNVQWLIDRWLKPFGWEDPVLSGTVRLVSKEKEPLPVPTGERHGQLTVIGVTKTAGGSRILVCRCDCGNETTVTTGSLRSGNKKSCGCAAIAILKARHKREDDARGRPTRRNDGRFAIWSKMKDRCTNRNSKDWGNYGGRGISVCERWNSFDLFAQDVGPRPSQKHSIDRIDTNGNYEPTNVRWSTALGQGRNKRTNTVLSFKGKTHCLSAWSDDTGTGVHTLAFRVKSGWTAEETITIPVRVMAVRAKRTTSSRKQ